LFFFLLIFAVTKSSYLMRKTLFFLFLGLCFFENLSAQLDPVLQARIDSLFVEWDNPESPGYALGIVQGGELVYARGYGQATLEYDVPITPQTVFHMASVSKQFTAFAIALLHEEGKLSLNDDIREHLPELADFGQPITIRHLVHHISGLRDQWNLLALAGWRLDDVITREQIMGLLERQEALNFPPGDQYTYCNSGYTLMAEIVSRLSGKPFPEWMKERVFEPLGMQSTLFYDDHERIVLNRAYSYEKTDDGYKKSVLSYANVGATSLFTTVEDMAKWSNHFRDPVVGSEKTLALMHERGILNAGDTIPYAFGQVVGEHGGRPTVSHGGADAGYRTHFVRFPEDDLAIIVLSNFASSNPGGVAYRVADILFGEEAAAIEPANSEQQPGPVTTISLSPEELQRYAGSFYFDQVGVRATTSVRADSLFVRQEWNGQEYAVVPANDSTFIIPADGEGFTIIFRNGEHGAIEKLLLQGGSNTYEGVLLQLLPEGTPLQSYTGRFYSRELDTAYDLIEEDGKLTVRHLRHPAFPLELIDPDTALGEPWFFGKVQFDRDDAGRITGMRVSSGRVKDVVFLKVQG